jgi:thiol:disulfide interchange protein
MKHCFALLLALVAWLPFASAGQENHAKASLYVREQGDELQLAIEVDIGKGWHLYHGPTREDMGTPGATGTPTTVTFTAEGFEFGPIRIANKPKAEEQDFGSVETIYEHVGKITIHARAKKTTPGADATKLSAEIAGLTCLEVDGRCVPYGETLTPKGRGTDALFANFPADLPLTAGAASTTPAPGVKTQTDATPAADIDYAAVEFADYTPRSDASTHGFAAWLLLAFIAGLILNVMPCVLPVVSIKILSFVQQAGESRSRILSLGLAFSGGILVVFVVLAALAAFAGQGWGEQFQSPKFIVVMIAVVFAFSLSMFDVFELGVPSQVGALAGSGQREGLGDAFMKGIMATVLATPCSGPFLGSTLAWSVTQSAGTVFLVFMMIGLGMASPYVLLTAFPSALKIVPKPGAWMQTFKHLMGFLLLGTVIYLMTSLRQDLLLFTVAFLLFVGIACWVWGRYATFDQKLGARLGTLAATLLVLAVGARLTFVDLRGMFTKGGGSGHLAWVEFDPVLLAKYNAEGRSVFVDFTANWCPNCKYNEFRVYESDEIRALIEQKDIVPMKADITNDGPRTDMIRRLMLELGATSIPLCAVFPGDRPNAPDVRLDIVTIATMRALFEACPDPKTK